MKILKVVLVSGLLCSSFWSLAQKDPIFSPGAKAIKGYDPVAYFKSGSAIKGTEENTLEWMGSKWFFQSQENLDLFKESPEKYAPQNGGYCAYAVSQGYTYSTNPQAWKIVDGKLYLNYSKGVQQKWEANQSEFISNADSNWPKVLEK